MIYKFKLPIGDWSGDRHGKTEDFLIESNKPLQEVRELYFRACEKLGFTLDGYDKLTPCSEYGDSTIKEETLNALLEFGVKIDENLVDSLKESYEQDKAYLETESMCDIVLEFIKTQDKTLELVRIPKKDYPMFQFYGYDEKKRHIGYFGYGLFD